MFNLPTPVLFIIVAAAIVVVLLLLRRIFFQAGPIPTGKAPVRAPNVTFNGIDVDATTCDGKFKGTGTISAGYPPKPPARGNAVQVKVTPKIVDVRNTSTSFNPALPDPLILTIDNTDFNFNFEGMLKDPCKGGEIRFEGTAEGEGRPPANETLPKVSLDIGAGAYKLVNFPAEATRPDNVNFSHEFIIECCGAEAGDYTVSVENQAEVTVTKINPVTFTCMAAGAQIKIETSGTRSATGAPGNYTIIIKTPVPNERRCRVGTVIVE